MKKWLLLFAISFIAASPSFGVNPVKKVVFHCPDQSNWVTNDSKKVFGEGSLGQTFTPEQAQLSFFRVGAVKNPANFKMINPDESAALELRLWKCGQDYQKTKENLPLALVRENQGLWMGNSLYFKVDSAIAPHAPYYAELTAFATPQPCYSILWNYQGDHYPMGDLVQGNLRWGNSDLSFSSCYPVELQQNGKLAAAPELVEINFDQDMDAEKTNATLELAGQKSPPVSKIWQGKTQMYLAVGKIAGNSEPLSGVIKINSVTAGGTEESNEIPFTILSPAKTEACKTIESKGNNAIYSSETIATEKVMKGIVCASCSDIRNVKGKVEFSIDAWVSPVIGVEVSFGQITPETVKALKEHNINTVSVTLPLLEGRNPELMAQIKDKIALMHKNGLVVFWLINLSNLGCDPAILGSQKDIYEINWQGKVSKKRCFNNPVVQKAFVSNLNYWLEEFKKNQTSFEGIIINEPGRTAGDFCYCNSCKQKFMKEFNCAMPEPVNTAGLEKALPIDWPAGLPKSMYRKGQDEDKWHKMSTFYCAPVTEMIKEIFKDFRHYFPDTCCQVTTLTDIAPYYGLDFWNGIMNLSELNGIQTAIYWAVGGHSPTTVGAPGIAKSFVGKAKAKNITCFYWLQGYDAGDGSAPLKSGDIKIAVSEAFKQNVDGILIWSYLNPILGPWDSPFHWPAYIKELKEAVTPYLKKYEVSDKKIELAKGEKKSVALKSDGSGVAYNIESALSDAGILSMTVKCNGYGALKKEIDLNTVKGE